MNGGKTTRQVKRRERVSMIANYIFTSLDHEASLLQFPSCSRTGSSWSHRLQGLKLAKGGDPMSHGSAMGSVKSVRGTRR